MIHWMSYCKTQVLLWILQIQYDHEKKQKSALENTEDRYVCGALNVHVVARLSSEFCFLMCVDLFAGDNRATTRWEWFVPCVFCLYMFVYFVAFLRCTVSAVLAVFSLLCSVCLCLRFLLVDRYRLHKFHMFISWLIRFLVSFRLTVCVCVFLFWRFSVSVHAGLRKGFVDNLRVVDVSFA